jgi:hypothetical protein
LAPPVPPVLPTTRLSAVIEAEGRTVGEGVRGTGDEVVTPGGWVLMIIGALPGVDVGCGGTTVVGANTYGVLVRGAKALPHATNELRIIASIIAPVRLRCKDWPPAVHISR